MKRTLSLLLAGAFAVGLIQLSSVSAAQPAHLSAVDASEVSTSYTYLLDNFYEKVDPQAVLDSVRTQLLTAMKKAGLKHGSLPVLHAAETPAGNVREIDRDIETAASESARKISAHDLTYVALDGMMSSVNDRYTVFLTPKEFAGLNQGLDGGDFGGTGIVIQVDDKTKYISVENVVPNGPADKAGIEQDDLITTIDGASTKGLSLPQASAKLRGKEGTRVTLTIVRDSAALPTITITRAKIHQLSVYEKLLPGKIGYVALTVFGRDTGSELTTALDRLQRQGARAIVLDLRDNGGGYLEAAVAVSSKFIPSGPIVSVESRASNITTLDADNTAINPIPLAVLVNGYTASASEITSGAIQDSSVGTIIGTKTFGKGVVQTIYPLPDGSAIKVTTARYLTPRNRDINHLGITPDIVVGENKHPRFGTPTQDDQLTRAIQYLDDKLAHLTQENGV
ncbi:MAG TPA: S41 family peptidase [Candidatus Cybelea sp.]|jgi:carboxyl-terminal processing protease|nr:S41 family peptidase [Candidatus Cybelea sp.]